MQPINALSLAPDARDWLANSRHPRVLHVFDRACNLINERREVLSIATPQIGNGPFNLVIPRLRKRRCGAVATSFERLPDLEASWQTSEVFANINLESLISISENQLTLGDLTINTEDAKLWSPRPDWEAVHARRYDILNQLTSLPLTNYQKYGLPLRGLCDTLFARKAQGYSATAFQPKLPFTNYQSLISNSLVSALATADIPASLIAARQLAGLGIGLTPAGDDFSLGAVLAAWIIHPPETASILAEEITNTAAPLTTSLSAAWLRSAGRGEAGILWHDFFDALISADPITVQESMGELLAVGHTSGADALAGFVGTLMRWAELASTNIP